MKPPGAYKIRRRYAPAFASAPDSIPLGVLAVLGNPSCKTQRVIESLRREIASSGPNDRVRIRLVFETPREIYRVELERPEFGYHRTTLLERDALEELLAADEVRSAMRWDAARVAER